MVRMRATFISKDSELGSTRSRRELLKAGIPGFQDTLLCKAGSRYFLKVDTRMKLRCVLRSMIPITVTETIMKL